MSWIEESFFQEETQCLLFPSMPYVKQMWQQCQGYSKIASFSWWDQTGIRCWPSSFAKGTNIKGYWCRIRIGHAEQRIQGGTWEILLNPDKTDFGQAKGTEVVVWLKNYHRKTGIGGHCKTKQAKGPRQATGKRAHWPGWDAGEDRKMPICRVLNTNETPNFVL